MLVNQLVAVGQLGAVVQLVAQPAATGTVDQLVAVVLLIEVQLVADDAVGTVVQLVAVQLVGAHPFLERGR